MKFQITNLYVRQMIAECIGSFVLVFMIDAAVASYGLLPRGSFSDTFAIATVAGIALYLALLIGATAGAGHATPIVTVALAAVNKFDWSKVPGFVFAHYVGGILATALAYFNYHDAIYYFDGGRRQFDGRNGTAFIFTSLPARHSTLQTVFFDQFICCALIMYIVMLVIDNKRPDYIAAEAKPALGFMLTGVVLCFELNAAAAINPARDLPGRLFLLISGYGSRAFYDLDGAYWVIGGLLGPHVGAIAGAWLYYLTIEMHEIDHNQVSPF